VFSYADADGVFIDLPSVFQAKHGGWMGSKVGLFCLTSQAEASTGYADFQSFNFSSR
jgi:hypothetical protein